MIGREYSNQVDYDSLQVQGGSGFMKDYPIERIYRDARITTIYEGTTQLQVVAAIRGVTTGAFLNRIRQYEEIPVKAEHDYLKKMLVQLTGDYTTAVEEVTAKKDTEYLDFHARRLVEMAGHIIMGYLLLLDAQRSEDYATSADIFIKRAVAENSSRYSYIMDFAEQDLGSYKSMLEEVLPE